MYRRPSWPSEAGVTDHRELMAELEKSHDDCSRLLSLLVLAYGEIAARGSNPSLLSEIEKELRVWALLSNG